MNKEVKDKQKLSEKTWFIILWLIVFFPVGLFFMWKSNWNKILKLIISAVIVIGIISALMSPSTKPAAPATTAVTNETSGADETKGQNPLLEYKIKEADVKNGTNTEVIGKWGCIKIEKSALKKCSQENIVDFSDSKIEGSGYNWFTIIFEDGTGIQFNGANKQIGMYGKIDDDGRITETIGAILLKSDNTYEYSNETLNSETTEAAEPSETSETIDESGVAEKESIPSEYKSALNQAKNYSDMMNMSKAGIYDQLTSEYGEQFAPEAAQYAIDNVEADWNENALIKAKTYSDMMSMSKAGIYDQLISEQGEQFTPEEAQYAVDNVVADWNANALTKAKTYQETMDMSPKQIHDQLTSEYGEKFTLEEADYAIANLN